MIQITQGTTGNELVVTLQEAVTIPNPDFVWRLTSLATGATVIFYAQDVSQSTVRYDKFLVDEVADGNQDYQDGKIHLEPTGFWKYEVFQTAGATPHNLNLSQAQGIVETGILNVVGPTTSDYSSLTAGDSTPIPVFEG